MKKKYAIWVSVLGLILIFLSIYGFWQLQQNNESHQAVFQQSSSPMPSAIDSISTNYSIKTETDIKTEASIKSLSDYSQISGFYSAFAKKYQDLGVSSGEDYVNEENAASPCILLYVYGKEDWRVQTQLNKTAMVSFGVTMPLDILDDPDNFAIIADVLAQTYSFYGNTITPGDIETFISENAENELAESTTDIESFTATIDIQDDFITINFSKK